MFTLIYRSLTFWLKPSPLNKGERDQPAPLEVQEKHLENELERVRAEQERLKLRVSPSSAHA